VAVRTVIFDWGGMVTPWHSADAVITRLAELPAFLDQC
jgi:hypothetical protein